MARPNPLCARRIQHHKTPHHRTVANRRKEAEQRSRRQDRHGTGSEKRGEIPTAKGGRHRANVEEKENRIERISRPIQAWKTQGGKHKRKLRAKILHAERQPRIH